MFINSLNGGVSNRSIAITIIICTFLIYVSYTFNVCLIAKLSRTLQKYPLRNLLSTNDAFILKQNVTSNDTSRRRSNSPHNGALPLTTTTSVAGSNAPTNSKNSSRGFLKILESFVRIVPLNISWSLNTNLVSEERSSNKQSSIDSSKSSTRYRLHHQNGSHTSRHLPDTLIIGVKKSGTRALLEFIRLHPSVRAVGYEVHFFDRNYSRGLHWYRRHMPYTAEGQITMEKTPSYFITKEVPRRVHHMNPATRLLIVVRDPVTRAISDYTQAASKKADMKRFEELAFINSSYAVVDTSWGPVKIGVYARYLERWLQYFPLSQLLFVSGERLITDPAYELGRVQDFLGLSRFVTERHFYFNATKGFPCLFYSEARSTPHCLGKTKGRNHPHIDPAAIDRLREFYKPFNNKFYQMTGINFQWP